MNMDTVILNVVLRLFMRFIIGFYRNLMRFIVIDNLTLVSSCFFFKLSRWEIKLVFGVALYISLYVMIDCIITPHDIKNQYFL